MLAVATLAFLVAGAGSAAAVAFQPQKFVCRGGQCVPDSRGLPLLECEAACTAPPGTFVCQGGQCVNSSTGVSRAECAQICTSPGPPGPPPPGPPPGGKTIVDLAVATPDLSTLVTALKAGKLASTLSGRGPFTVFAPTNEAFANIPAATLSSLLDPENIKQLDDVLTYHVLVVAGDVHARDLKDGEKLKTVEGKSLSVRLSGKDILINSAKVTSADNDASNGVVHIIDSVLFPAGPPPAPSGQKNIVQLAQSVPTLSTLVTAVVAANLTYVLSSPGPFTVFAPNNGAFAKIPPATLKSLLDPENILQLIELLEIHVVSGRVRAKDLKSGEKIKTVDGGELTVLINPISASIFVYSSGTKASEVIAADNEASNGVVHIVSKVLLPRAA